VFLLLSARILECDSRPHLHSVVLRRAKRVTNLCGFSHGKFQGCDWILIYLGRRGARECHCQICIAVLYKKRGGGCENALREELCVCFHLFLTGRVGCTIPFVCNIQTGLNDPVEWRAWVV